MGLAKVRPQSQETQMGNQTGPPGIMTGPGGEPEIQTRRIRPEIWG